MPLLHKTPRMSKNWFWSEMLQVSEGLEKEYKSWAETSWWLKSKHKPWVNIEIRFMVPFFEEIKLQLLLRVIHELEGWGNLPPASWRPFPICTQAAVSSSCFDVCMQVFFYKWTSSQLFKNKLNSYRSGRDQDTTRAHTDHPQMAKEHIKEERGWSLVSLCSWVIVSHQKTNVTLVLYPALLHKRMS